EVLAEEPVLAVIARSPLVERGQHLVGQQRTGESGRGGGGGSAGGHDGSPWWPPFTGVNGKTGRRSSGTVLSRPTRHAPVPHPATGCRKADAARVGRPASVDSPLLELAEGGGLLRPGDGSGGASRVASAALGHPSE